jgi:LacI family transcriptional regulator
MGASLKQIAQTAGVSEATASLALNNRPGVNTETRQRICDVAKELGYIPNISARVLAKQKSGLIGVIVPNLVNLIYSTFVRAIEEALRTRGYKMILATNESNVDYEKAMLEHFTSFRVEGVIVYPIIQENPNPGYLNMLTVYDIPFIFLGGYYKGVKASHVMSDLYGAICGATEYLCERGARNFYYVGGCKSIVTNSLKINALRDTLRQKGLSFKASQYIELAGTNYQNAHDAAEQFFSDTSAVDALFVADAYTSLAVYNVLVEKGFRIPEDIQLISFDNLIPPEICKVRLTCIEQNISEIVKTILEELFAKINGNKVDKNILVATRLVVRDTTR